MSALSESRQAGTDEMQAWDGHGVFVPKGMSAEEIMRGAAVLERRFDVVPFVSRSMVIAVLSAIRGHQGNSGSENASNSSS
jgi:hypothetical protein